MAFSHEVYAKKGFAGETSIEFVFCNLNTLQRLISSFNTVLGFAGVVLLSLKCL